MIVTKENFLDVVDLLEKEIEIALDTETFGLRTYHGDVLFSIILTTSQNKYYFNFIDYVPKLEAKFILPREWLPKMAGIWKGKDKLWFIQNAANFDLCVLAVDGIFLEGTIHCTKAIGRIEYNEHMSYSLEAQLSRIGDKKDDAVMNYINEHKLYTKVSVPGKATKVKLMRFNEVPFETIVPYGEQDAHGTFNLAKHQINSIREKDKSSPPGRELQRVMENERRLQKTIFRMRHRGVLIDLKYCERAIKYEFDREEKAKAAFKRETGRDYLSSPQMFESVFESEKSKWEFTDKGNPSFESGTLAKFDNPAAKMVLQVRDAKSKSDFYNGFLYHADSKGFIHPNYNPEGTRHGRFSSSEPNWQNLTSEESEEELAGEFIVRRAIIPRPGHILIMPDYDQMEYKFMLEMACRTVQEDTDFAKKIRAGMDFHTVTVENAGSRNVKISRNQAKTTNFLTIYGGGNKKLAENLGITQHQAYLIRQAIFDSAPEVDTYISTIMDVARKRKFIINWLGRRCYFPNSNFAYRAPNYHISGGCADVVKVAMNRIDEYLLDKKSAMIMTVHDELPCEIHEDEIDTVPRMVKQIMEEAFPYKYVPLTAGMEYSTKSLGDKQKGWPSEAGNTIQK